MELKKKSESNLETYKIIFLLLGFITALSWSIIEYEKKFYDVEVSTLGDLNIADLEEEEMQKKYKFRLIGFSSSEVYGDYEGVMSEDVMEKYEIKQMNDYAMTKWVNEMQINKNSSVF
jgi:nucleoside-diphosphate-sugar epimerase